MEGLVRRRVVTGAEYLPLALSGTNVTTWKEYYAGQAPGTGSKRPREEEEVPLSIPVDGIHDLYHRYHGMMGGVCMGLHTDARTTRVRGYAVNTTKVSHDVCFNGLRGITDRA